MEEIPTYVTGSEPKGTFFKSGLPGATMKTLITTKYRTAMTVALCSAGFCLTLGAAEPAAHDSSLPPAYGMKDRADLPKTDLKHGDKSFVEKAAKGGMEEVAISRVAIERATNPQVREFAQMMVSDHTGANSDLMALAMSKNVMLPAKDISVEKWEKRNAKGFDEEYMEKMVSDHKDTIELFEKESKKGEDADLMNFAGKTLPTLVAHLAKAQELKKLVK
jgi:putative membrane protein